MKQTLTATHLNLPGITQVYHGKVRDVYTFQNGIIAMVATDRISAFDVVLPRGIPFKGQVLNQMAGYFLDATRDMVPNWKLDSPDPVVTVGIPCAPIRIEMVIRGYLAGHAWREYCAGKRLLSGEILPDGMRENDPFQMPIITPATKADEGHDEDISRDEIIARGIVSEEDYQKLESYTRQLFANGSEMALARGLILVDTKYEFGRDAQGQIRLIDEIHTPDSSRYFYRDGFSERQERGEKQLQLSKEFVREWLMSNGFQGKAGQKIPDMDDAFVNEVSDRYIMLYEQITGNSFQKANTENIPVRVEQAIEIYLKGL